MTKQMLQYMLEDLNIHRKTPEQLMTECVENRLNASLNVYNTELQATIQFLSRKHEKSLMKRLTKLDGKFN